MQYREVSFTFPEEATDRDKVVMVLQSPYSFVRWCRTRVGIAPNTFHRVEECCVLEQYLLDVTGIRCLVAISDILTVPAVGRPVTSPTWIQRVIEYVDIEDVNPTYNDVANMLLALLERNELA